MSKYNIHNTNTKIKTHILSDENMKNAGFENIYETKAGGTITSHCGEHVLGILYINDGNK